MKMYSWQKRALKHITNRRLRVIGMARGTGKSRFMRLAMRMMKSNSDAWTKWERTFTVWPKQSHTGKWIWGKIMVRRNILVIYDEELEMLEYASCKEAFEDNLKNG